MEGAAKKLFYSTHQRTPWRERLQQPYFASGAYPLLDLLLSQQQLSYFDYAWTANLLRSHRGLDENVALGLCHLLLAAKSGHLCVKIEEDSHSSPFPSFSPHVLQVWTQSHEPPSNHLELSQRIAHGLRHIPSDLLQDIDSGEIGEINDSNPISKRPLCRHRNRIYLQKYWEFESQIAKNLARVSSTPPAFSFDESKIVDAANALSTQGLLLPEQAQAILQGCLSPMSLITGGPGTGKTYTVAHLIKVFWENLSPEQREHFEIALAAPTGKAAAHLHSNVMKLLSESSDLPNLSSKTLHALLGIKSPRWQRDDSSESAPPLSADLIVVDESSMIDVALMNRLLASVKKGARLLLVGDQYQLPAVEAGSLFADFIRLNMVPCTHLKTCLRTELRSILAFAKAVNSGDAKAALELIHGDSDPALRRLLLPSDPYALRQALWSLVHSYFPGYHPSDIDPKTLLSRLNRFCLLSPVRKGVLGVDALNRYLWEKVCSTAPREGWLSQPIMVISNDYQLNLFNGEIGLLMRKLPLGSSHEDYALFPGKSAEEVRKVPLFLLPKYEYAYCFSVHKSQGSEFDHVILMLPEGSEKFGREILYTAVTRARKRLEIIGSDTAITRVITQSCERLSGLTF